MHQVNAFLNMARSSAHPIGLGLGLYQVALTSLLPRSTIFAACSGHGKCGITVFRISGSQASVVLSKVAHMNESLKPRRAYLRHLYHPISKVDIDRGIVLWFPGIMM